MGKDSVSIKGVAEGIYIDVKGNDLDSIVGELELKLKKSGEFFKGAKCLDIRGEEISKENSLEIRLLLKYKYDMKVNIPELFKIQLMETEKAKFSPDEKQTVFNEVEEGMTKFVHGTLRSGQEVSFNGNIVVIGDVNPGALLRAKGNIVVLGTLRGVAQAGIGGNTKAVVAAYSLLPTQLRISDIIVRPPEDDVQYKYPEIAKVVNDKVVIEPYLPNK